MLHNCWSQSARVVSTTQGTAEEDDEIFTLGDLEIAVRVY